MKSSAVLICNPTAGGFSRRKLEAAEECIKSHGFDLETLLTGKRGDAEAFAAARADEEGRTVFVAGGDGTINEVVNGLAGKPAPMAVIPIGTTNVLARELALPKSVEEAVGRAVRGPVRTISLGRISAGSDTRYFSLMAGIGYDGETVYRLREGLKRIHGKGAYVFSGIMRLVSWNPERLSLDIDGVVADCFSAIILNSSKYAGDFTVAPGAGIEDHFLHAVLLHGKNRTDIIRYAIGMLAERHTGFRDVSYIRSRRISVEGQAHVQIDGDYFGTTPAEIEAVPEALRLSG